MLYILQSGDTKVVVTSVSDARKFGRAKPRNCDYDAFCLFERPSKRKSGSNIKRYIPVLLFREMGRIQYRFSLMLVERHIPKGVENAGRERYSKGSRELANRNL